MKRLRFVAVVGCLFAVCVATAAPSATAKKKAPSGRITAGLYTTQAVPGTEALGGFMYRLNLFKPKPTVIQGRRITLQSFAFLKWLQETSVPADGIVHFCGMGGRFPISPPGLPNGTPAGLLDYRGMSPVYPVVAATGKPLGWPDQIAPDGPARPFSFHGRFNEKKHLIKITGTCDGITQTHTYKLTKRF